MILSIPFGSLGLQLLVFFGMVFFIRAFLIYFMRLFYRVRERRENKNRAYGEMVAGDSIKNILLRLHYFRALSSAGQDKFAARVEKALDRLEFSAEGNIEADAEKRVLIAAAAIQITFGLRDYDIDSIERIKIFADDIYNPKNKVRFKGLTFMNGNMFISWKHFLDGIRAQDDGINLGLHETAHGLYILLKQYRGYDDIDAILEEWYKYAYHEIDHENSGKQFFRKYADTNIQEFFAICIENFFERPAEFQKRVPLIYGRLCTFLNQDPLNPNDYEFVPQYVPMSGAPSEKLYLHKNRPHGAQGLMLWFSFASVVGILVLKPFFLETLFNLLLFSVPCMFISYVLFKKVLLNNRRMSKRAYLIFCFTCVNPMVFICIMLLNLGISTGIQGKRSYRVSGSTTPGILFSQNDLTFTREGHTFYELEDNGTVPMEQRLTGRANMQVHAIEYSYHYGIMGLKVADSRELK